MVWGVRFGRGGVEVVARKDGEQGAVEAVQAGGAGGHIVVKKG